MAKKYCFVVIWFLHSKQDHLKKGFWSMQLKIHEIQFSSKKKKKMKNKNVKNEQKYLWPGVITDVCMTDISIDTCIWGIRRKKSQACHSTLRLFVECWYVNRWGYLIHVFTNCYMYYCI